ncbi:galectin-4-like isoform X2 [Dermacentor albipictus]|uniref:galectin-4-like isoform X2 n=1 Tax=Dermacentor albipictus TaxID=60249 RepID=UPI0031FDE989
MTSPIYNPPLPYVGPIPGGVLSIGTLIRIQGTPHHSARCFAVNLQCGPNVHPRDDIALHLSPVFSPPPRIVRNSIQAQQWGPEESHGDPFPLVAGQSFELLVLVEHDQYKIAINGKHYTEFWHRIPIQRVTHLTMDGDTAISLVQFEGIPSMPLGPGMPMPMPVAPPSGRVSPYGDTRFGAPYPPQAGYPPGGGYYPPTAGMQPAYPGGGGYPAHGPGVQYVPHPGDQKHSSGLGTGLGAGLAAGAAALAGSSLLKHGMGHKKGFVPAMAGAALGSGLHHKSHGYKPKSSMPLPIGAGTLGTGLAVGATALAGAALAKKLKPKKMFKHKHKHGWKGWSSSSSSSSSSEEE